MLSRVKITMLLDISSTSGHAKEVVVTDIKDWLPQAVEDHLMPDEGIIEFSVELVDK